MIILTRKKQNEILKRIIANEIMFTHAMGSLPACKEWFETTEQFIQNNCDMAIMVDGIKGALKVKNTLDKYDSSKQ